MKRMPLLSYMCIVLVTLYSQIIFTGILKSFFIIMFLHVLMHFMNFINIVLYKRKQQSLFYHRFENHISQKRPTRLVRKRPKQP